MMMRWTVILLAMAIAVFISCKNVNNRNSSAVQPIKLPHPAQHVLVNKLTDVIVHDILSPPVASRVYAYCLLAYYEALRPAAKNAVSLTGQLNGFDKIPGPPQLSPEGYSRAAAESFFSVAEQLCFSKDSVRAGKFLMESLYPVETHELNAIHAWADTVAAVIKKRAANDNYKKTRGMPRYSVYNEEGRWQQTPPDYSDAVEPYWHFIQPLLMDSSAQCKAAAPPEYDISTKSNYYRELHEVFTISKQLTGQQDTIAVYWDDNPFVTVHTGHLMYANKKITPVGHWIGITQIINLKAAANNQLKTARMYALSAGAMFDGFIACWEEKYRSRGVRPVTVIRKVFNSEWNSRLQTPPFPEYTSGHSVVSAAAATVLQKEFGAIAFNDTIEMKYLGLQRSFSSPVQAAEEAGISRLYGGIHYRSAIVEGKRQGQKVGELFTRLN